jgi:hypothetical protein|tara:strand:+ start:760 stop:930 length:171 start_codon:yes stop_codon:yes gene_type:complete
MNDLITLVGLVLNFIMFIYIIYTIPSRVKKNGTKLDTVTKNQTIIEKLIKKVGGLK